MLTSHNRRHKMNRTFHPELRRHLFRKSIDFDLERPVGFDDSPSINGPALDRRVQLDREHIESPIAELQIPMR